MRQLRPPFYKQEKDNSCLPACLRMVLAARSVFLSEQQVRELCGWHPQRATTSTATVAAARALGFLQAREDYELRLYDLRDALRKNMFPIVGIDLQPYGLMGQHAQVVVSVSARGVTLQDPLLGQFTTSLFVFEQAWSGSDFLAILVE